MTDDFDSQFNRERHEQRRLDDEAWLRAHRPAKFVGHGPINVEVAAWFKELLADQKPGNLILCGPVGTGKSWHLWRIVTELVLHHRGRGHLQAVTADEFKQAAAPPTDYDRLNRFAETGLLLVDDIGSVRLSDWDLDNLFGVIDRRWANNRPSVINSNALDLRALLGERIASRLADKVTLVELEGSDRRRDES